jgi:hypothetical protein
LCASLVQKTFTVQQLPLNDAGQRLSRLFLTQLALNASFGLVIGVALWLIGVPSAPLWGMLAMIMRFVPYIGALTSAIFPLVLAAAVGPGWAMVLMTAALFLIAETVVGQVIEPMIYGHSTGLSPVAVITAATFWTWLWGPIGLILATPLTTCLVVLGRHVEQLKFLQVMFGDEPPLTPAELIYQRMLARDPIEAADQARVVLKEKPLTAYYDEVLLEGCWRKQTPNAACSTKIDCTGSAMWLPRSSTTLRPTRTRSSQTSILQRATLFSLSSKRPRPKLRKKGYRSAGATANPFYAYRDRASSTRL